MKKKLFIISPSFIMSVVLFIPQAFAEQLPCKEKYIETIYLSQTIMQATKKDFNEPLQKYLKKIESVSSELELKEFDLTTTDISASRNSYSQDIYDYSISVSITFLKDTRAFTTFMQKLMPISGSSSVTKQCL